jgi:hypothetical protein
LESCLGKPVTTHAQEHRAGKENGGIVCVANEVNGSPVKIEPAA